MKILSMVSHYVAKNIIGGDAIPISSTEDMDKTKLLSVVTAKKRLFRKMKFTVKDVNIPLKNLVHNTKQISSSFEKDFSIKGDCTIGKFRKSGGGAKDAIKVESLDIKHIWFDSDKVDIRIQINDSIEHIKNIVSSNPKIDVYVVKGIYQTCGTCTMKCTKSRCASASAEVVVIGAEGNFHSDNRQTLTINDGSTLCYSLWKLKFNKDGSVQDLVQMSNTQTDEVDGIDSSEDRYEEIASFEELLKPLENDKSPELNACLLKLMACCDDVKLLSQLLTKAEEGTLDEENVELAERDAVKYMLSLAGVKTDERIVYHQEADARLTAVGYIVDALEALLDLNLDLEPIFRCNELQLKGLRDVFKSMTEGSTNTVPDEPTRIILQNIGFTFTEEEKKMENYEADENIWEYFYCVCLLL